MKILIVSATRENNYRLAKKIGGLLHADYKMITLEDYELPLYKPGGENADESKMRVNPSHQLWLKILRMLTDLFFVHRNTMLVFHPS